MIMELLTIPVHEIGVDAKHYSWHVGKEFFDSFETSEIIDADLETEAEVSDDGAVSVKCHVSGNVTVQCDRCLADLVMPVDTSFEDEDHPIEGNLVDLRQDVYDYVCISLPLQRVHEEGACDPEVLKFLSHS